MEYQLFNFLGLVFGIIGVIILYRNSRPPTIGKDGTLYVFNEGDPYLTKLITTQLKRNRIGIGFVIVGIMLQLVTTIPKETSTKTQYNTNTHHHYYCCDCCCYCP